MSEGLFQNKYRIKSTRIPSWDYGSDGYYFVTICTKDKVCYFGDVVDGEMRLSKIGWIVATEWQKTPEIRPGVFLDFWIIMPNHIHGIIIIQNENIIETPIVETPSLASLRNDIPYKNEFGPQNRNLSSIIRGFKSSVTKQIRIKYPNLNFQWQERFYDRIIRDERALDRIRTYISSNPSKWQEDLENVNRS